MKAVVIAATGIGAGLIALWLFGIYSIFGRGNKSGLANQTKIDLTLTNTGAIDAQILTGPQENVSELELSTDDSDQAEPLWHILSRRATRDSTFVVSVTPPAGWTMSPPPLAASTKVYSHDGLRPALVASQLSSAITNSHMDSLYFWRQSRWHERQSHC
jgi:hypothetical protein